MGRIPDPGPALGSKHWLRVLINQRPDLFAERLSQAFGWPVEEAIAWLSPLVDDEYAEYKDQCFLDRLGVLPTEIGVPLNQFWPPGGPQWDGLGTLSGRRPLLVEAKAYIEESYTTGSQATYPARALIQQSLNATKYYLRSTSAHDWSSIFYQQANRLAHLYFLRELNKIDAYLILVYFFNDNHVRLTTEQEWRGANRL
jgi:hypothetical protein